MNTGDVIKMLRKKSGMTQDDLARKLGVTKSSVQKYENGLVQNLKLQTIRDLCNIFHAPPWYFIFPEQSVLENEKEVELLKKQAMFIIKIYAQLSRAGRERLFLCMEDIVEIKKYLKKDAAVYDLELHALKEVLQYYEKGKQ